MQKRLIRILVLSVLGIFLAGVYVFMTAPISQQKSPRAAWPVAGSSVGGPYTLIDHTGKTVTEKDFAGLYQLIYFGFTFCPAICPTELQKVNAVLGRLGPDAEKIQPLFITIDPERDTQPVMASYVAQFNPRLVGLTGTREQINTTLKAYKVYARKVEDPNMSDYTMDHSSYIYFMDPEGVLIGVYGISSTPDEILTDIQRAFAS